MEWYIGMDCREVGWEGEDWMHLTQDRDLWRALVNPKDGEFCD